ncbi:MAG: YbhB/YbcL family Raf kinase inhibitor-like protein [Brevinematales bacterium]|nr:YbhB/YbcL family Raf kinase inhibitor-like protein [Brevinematales bacterium]
MKIESPAFPHGGMIPSLYSCDGENISPELVWKDVPPQTKSLVLLCEDPDAPMGLFVHWIVFNIPASLSGFPAGVSTKELLRLSIKQGRTDFGSIGYGGPCPPSGTHRYFFRLYALDNLLSLAEGSNRAQVLKAMEGHVLSHAELMGTYHRKR